MYKFQISYLRCIIPFLAGFALTGSATNTGDQQAITLTDVQEYCTTEPNFAIGTNSILVWLLRLKLCEMVAGKKYLQTECKVKRYTFTKYYNAAYCQFCDSTKFAAQCPVDDAIERDMNNMVDMWLNRVIGNNSVTSQSTTAMTTMDNDTSSSMMSSFFNIESQYCEQISDFFQEFAHAYNTTTRAIDHSSEIVSPFSKAMYSEWFLTYRPFCAPVACGVGRTNYDENPTQAHQCFATSCSQAISLTLVTDCLIALVIVTANVMVLLVAWRTNIMSNVPGFFKISLAIADLMVGLMVLPGSVYQNYRISFLPLPFRTDGVKPQSGDYFSKSYLNFMGFFTVLSLAASLNFLFVASIDRYLSVTRPFKTQRGKYVTKKRAPYIVVSVWVYAIALAIFPVFVTADKYQIIALSLVFTDGVEPAIVYAVSLGTPLICMWALNFSMLHRVGADNRNSSRHHATSTPQTRSHRRYSRDSALSSNGNGASAKHMQRRTSSPQTSQVTTTNTTTTSNGDSARTSKIPEGFDSNSYWDSNMSFYAEDTSVATYSSPSKNGTLKNTPAKTATTLSPHSIPSFIEKSRRKWSIITISKHVVEKSLTKTLVIMVAAFTIAIVPAIIVILLTFALEESTDPKKRPQTYNETTMNRYTTFLFFSTRMYLSNSFFNCIIYSVRNKLFRRALLGSFIWNKTNRRRRLNRLHSAGDGIASGNTAITSTYRQHQQNSHR